MAKEDVWQAAGIYDVLLLSTFHIIYPPQASTSSGLVFQVTKYLINRANCFFILSSALSAPLLPIDVAALACPKVNRIGRRQ